MLSSGRKPKKKDKDKDKDLKQKTKKLKTNEPEKEKEKEDTRPPVIQTQKTDKTEAKDTGSPTLKVRGKQAMRPTPTPPKKGGKAALASDDLLMRTGSVDALLGDGKAWTQLAAKLKATFHPYIMNEYKAKPPRRNLDYADLCTIYHVPGNEQPVVKDAGDTKRLNEWPGPGQAQDVADFLTALMKSNGQLDYIKNTDWFKDGQYIIGIDVNYYPDRSGFQDFPRFHKDTGGNNVFVNLIFDNEQEIEATEWFPDLEEPGVDRANWQEALLPASHLKDLKEAREDLRTRYNQTDNIAGGTSQVPHTFLSWVDDLVWHSSPGASQRFDYSADQAMEVYEILDQASNTDDRSLTYVDPTYNEKIPGVELLGSILDVPGTHLSEWLKDKGLTPQSIDANGPEAWVAVYSGPEGLKRYKEDVAKRADGSEIWKLTGVQSEANAYDPRLKDMGSYSITETPPRLSTRKRANSFDPDDLLRAREANKGKERSFIRTWVRILSTGSEEGKRALANT